MCAQKTPKGDLEFQYSAHKNVKNSGDRHSMWAYVLNFYHSRISVSIYDICLKVFDCIKVSKLPWISYFVFV